MKQEGVEMKRLVLAAIVGAAVVLAPSALAAPLQALKAPSCNLLSQSKIASVLGIPISSTTIYNVVPNELTCYYATKKNPDAVVVTFQTQDGYSAYLTAKAQAKPFVKTVKGIGGGAFYDSSADFATEPVFNVLYGNVCMTIDAFAPLKRVETLAKTMTGAF
jgi:hypothetical protein